MTTTGPADRAHFERLYRQQDDPYGLRHRWYEARKRAVLLASLPRRRYRHAYEPGCGAAELTAELAPRCDRLLASDFSDAAVALARRRLQGQSHVQVQRHTLPQDWPQDAAPFDLIVLSEIGYFIEEAAWHEVADACGRSLAADGDLAACDWRPDFAQRRQPSDAVQAALGGLGLRLIARHDEQDFLLQVWSRDPRSVAQREGLR